MYQGLDHLIEGWSKNIYLGGRRSFPEEPFQRALVPVMLVIAWSYWLVPPAVLVTSAFNQGMSQLAPASLLAVAVSAVFWMLICYGMRIPPAYGLTYPLGALMALYIGLRSTWRGRRKVEWRGRVYEGGERVSGNCKKRER